MVDDGVSSVLQDEEILPKIQGKGHAGLRQMRLALCASVEDQPQFGW